MPRESVRSFPLSYGQRALWYMQRLFPNSPLYNLQSCWRVLSDLDLRALRRTFQWLVDRHESLRTTYHLEGRVPIQIVHPGQTAFFQVQDASEWTEEEFRTQVDREVHRPFDLERGPLFRVQVFLREPGKHLLVTSFHHITADLWSMTLIYQEMQRLYPAAREGALPPPAPAPAYADYVRWQREVLAGPPGDGLRKYWEGRFEGDIQELVLPLDFPRGPSPDCAGAAFPFKLSAELTSRLRELASRTRTTLHAVLLAGFETLLHLHSGSELFLIRTLTVGRSRADWEQVIGFFANPVVMRVDFRRKPSFLEAVARTQTRVSEAVDRQDYPFELLMEGVRFGRRLRFNPMSEVMFVLQTPQRFLQERRGQKCALADGMFAPGATGVRVDFGGLLAEKYNPGTRTTLNDIDLQAVEIGGELSGVINYRADLFRPATIARLSADLTRLLEGAAGHPEAGVGELAARLDLPRRPSRADHCRRAEPGAGLRSGPPTDAPSACRSAAIGATWRSADVEARLAAIAGEILGGGQPGPDDNFFELGANSLHALQLTLALREEFRVEIPLGLLFENPTLAGLAALVRRTEKITEAPPIFPSAGGDKAALSFAQERLWFIDRLVGGSFYNVPVAVRLRGPLDAGILERSLNRIIARHESLRTTFSVIDGRPVQVVQAVRPVAVGVERLESGTEEGRLREARGRLSRLAALPFDLERGPLLRLHVLTLDKEDHLALLVIHHIAADAWSFGLLLRELAAFYGSSILGGDPAVPELTVQYADYSEWQRRQAERLDREHLAFWNQVLAGAPILEFPADRPRPAVQTFRGGAIGFELAAPLIDKLRSFSLGESATPFMTLLAVFYVLLHRWSGADDIVVGSPVAGRVRPEVENLIGCFINPLPLRVDLGGDPAFRKLLAGVKDRVLAAFAHQEIPFERLVEEVRPFRDLSREPLFQVMFVFQNTPLPVLRLPGGPDLLPFELGREMTRYDLTLFLTESSQAWTGWLEYNSDIFRPESAGRLVRHYRNLVEKVLESPDLRLSEIPMMDDEEMASVTGRWNRTKTESAPPACVHRLFEEQAAASPGGAAVVFGDRTFSYAEINARADAIARGLAARGAGPEEIIGVCLERTPEMIAAVLGVLKSGAAYLPLDTSFPRKRISGFLEDAGAMAVLGGKEAALRLEGSRVPVLPVEDLDLRGSGSGDDAVRSAGAADPENLAYVIYTSGSTGRPKGVMITHGSLVNYIRWCLGAYRIREGQGVLLHSSIACDFTVTTLLAPLLAGQKIIISPDSPAGLPPEFLEESRGDLALLKLTPSHARALGRFLGAERRQGLARTLVLGGEALRWPQIADWVVPGSRLRIFNEYGPTEATVGCCVHRLEPADPMSDSVPIGRPIANTRIYILDRFLRPAPLGAPGEICVGGAGLARGYLGQPDLTAERFVPDPWGDEPGTRLYRTGDLARRHDDGTIEFLGRLDEQVKVRGYRVEIGEVEAALGDLPGVIQAAVAAVPDPGGGAGLRAFIAAGEAKTVSPEEVRAFLRSRLPEYMIPVDIMILDRLPLLASGKVDRRALQAAGRGRPLSRPVPTPPRTPGEIVIAQAFESVLHVKNVGARDRFFELGGHSLAAVELLSEIRKRSPGSKLGLLDIFKEPSVAGLARRLDALPEEGGTSGSPSPAAALVLLKSGGEGAPLFLIHPSGGQVEVYRPLADSLEAAGPVYGIAARGLANRELEHPTIEAMAEEYAGLIKEMCPAGPYRLAGWSMGAAVAIATAGALEREGADVDFVGLLDPALPMGATENPDSRSPLDLTGLLAALTGWLTPADEEQRELLGQLPGLYRSLPPLPEPDRAIRLVELAAERGLVRRPRLVQALLNFVNLLVAHERLLGAYRPQRIRAPIVIWQAEGAGRQPNPEAPAALTSGPWERVQAAGNHWQMLAQPEVGGLADDLSRRLAENGRRAGTDEKARTPAGASVTSEDISIFMVVANGEDQHSIWPSDRALPGGWRDTGVRGTKAACLESIRGLWIDLRPLTLRNRSPRRG